MNPLLKSLVYFDIFDYPLTLLELWKWSFEAIDWPKLLILKQNSPSREGFYFLENRKGIVLERIKRYNIAEKKFKKVLLIGRFLALSPFVRFIAVTNTLSYSNAPEESDIDLFIITSRNKIWTTRFYTAGLLKLLGLRPTSSLKKDKICLNFFLTEDNLNLKSILLESDNGGSSAGSLLVNNKQTTKKMEDTRDVSSCRPHLEDPHFAVWLAQFVPIYGKEELYTKFVEENHWLFSYFPNFFSYKTSPRRRINQKIGLRLIKKIGEIINYPSIIERTFRWLELRYLPRQIKLKSEESNTEVIINDKMLKFHVNDRRFVYREIFKKKLEFFKFDSKTD